MKYENQNLKQKFVPLAVHERRTKQFQKEYAAAIIGNQTFSAVEASIRNEAQEFYTSLVSKRFPLVKKKKR